MLLHSYPAVFYYVSESDGYYVYFPDLKTSGTQGKDISDAVYMAREYLGMLLADDLEQGRPFETASDIHDVSIEGSFPFAGESLDYDIDKTFVSMVTVDVTEYLGGQDLVKKTLSIPKWANDLGVKLGLNFSKELTEVIANKGRLYRLFFYVFFGGDTLPKRECRHQGCHVLVDKPMVYCPVHKPVIVNDRPTATQRGYDSRWRKARKAYLAKHPFCVECLKEGIHTLATDVDHIVPHKGSKILFWNPKNWQSLCHSCHSKKTAKENNGGWY